MLRRSFCIRYQFPSFQHFFPIRFVDSMIVLPANLFYLLCNHLEALLFSIIYQLLFLWYPIFPHVHYLLHTNYYDIPCVQFCLVIKLKLNHYTVINIRNNYSLQYSLHGNEQLSQPDHSKLAEVHFMCARNHVILDTEHKWNLYLNFLGAWYSYLIDLKPVFPQK